MIVVKYTLFAILSILLNLACQYIVFSVYAGFGSLYLAMFSGTTAGLAIKYILDRKYVFYYMPDSSIDDAKKFVSYTLMGVITTCIFWGTETAFDILSENKDAKYIGAVAGLTVGYISKYFLDKKYVFQGRAA
jgi:putative flippase GtrA